MSELWTRSPCISRLGDDLNSVVLPQLKADLLEEWKAEAKGYGAYSVNTDCLFNKLTDVDERSN